MVFGSGMVMASVVEWLLHPDLAPVLEHGTLAFLAIVFLVVFAESGLLIGFFLPGDSFLFSAGLVAGIYHRPAILVLALVAFVAAVIGDQVGYIIGQRTGPRLFQRPDSRIFKQSYVTKAHEFFERHGPKAVVLARFVPVVRTFTPMLAGVSGMRYRVFVTYNVVGGAIWAVLATMLGWGLGKRYPKIEDYLTPMAIVIVAVSVLPMVFEVWRRRRHAAATVTAAVPSPATTEDRV